MSIRRSPRKYVLYCEGSNSEYAENYRRYRHYRQSRDVDDTIYYFAVRVGRDFISIGLPILDWKAKWNDSNKEDVHDVVREPAGYHFSTITDKVGIRCRSPKSS